METDYFELLGLERRLALNGETLQECYDARSQEVHPDLGGESGEFDRVRQAHTELKSPGRRLRHWLKLGDVPIEEGGALPAVVTEHFGRIGELLHRAAELERRHASAKSVLARSLAEREGLGMLPQLQEERGRVIGLINDLEGQFGAYEGADRDVLSSEAAETARALLFLEKWEGQLRIAWGNLASW